MKTPHLEKRQQVWLAAFNSCTSISDQITLDQMSKFADSALKAFDERFTDTESNSILSQQLDRLKEYFAIKRLFPSMSPDVLFNTIRSNFEDSCRLKLIEKYYDVIWYDSNISSIMRKPIK